MLRSVEGASRSTGFSGPPNAGSNSSTTSPARLSVLDVTHSTVPCGSPIWIPGNNADIPGAVADGPLLDIVHEVPAGPVPGPVADGRRATLPLPRTTDPRESGRALSKTDSAGP